MLKTYQFKTQCKGNSHSSKTANIIARTHDKQRWTPLSEQAKYSIQIPWDELFQPKLCSWIWIPFRLKWKTVQFSLWNTLQFLICLTNTLRNDDPLQKFDIELCFIWWTYVQLTGFARQNKALQPHQHNLHAVKISTCITCNFYVY